MLKTLGRHGVARMVSQHCAQARRMAALLAQEPDIEILNDVVLNQVAVRLGRDLPREQADVLTQRTIARIQKEGTCFVGGAHWRGVEIVRVSVIGAATRDEDIERSAAAIVAAWRAEKGVSKVS
jgi:glutamate/tyrosine decarboxylase-like PLP-dependent enzyme